MGGGLGSFGPPRTPGFQGAPRALRTSAKPCPHVPHRLLKPRPQLLPHPAPWQGPSVPESPGQMANRFRHPRSYALGWRRGTLRLLTLPHQLPFSLSAVQQAFPLSQRKSTRVHWKRPPIQKDLARAIWLLPVGACRTQVRFRRVGDFKGQRAGSQMIRFRAIAFQNPKCPLPKVPKGAKIELIHTAPDCVVSFSDLKCSSHLYLFSYGVPRFSSKGKNVNKAIF